jgi:hypothetical protein
MSKFIKGILRVFIFGMGCTAICPLWADDMVNVNVQQEFRELQEFRKVWDAQQKDFQSPEFKFQVQTKVAGEAIAIADALAAERAVSPQRERE